MASNVFRILLLIAIFSVCNCTLNDLQLDRENELLAAAGARILNEVYNGRASAISLIRSATQLATIHRQSDILNRLLLLTDSNVACLLEEPQYMRLSPFLRFEAILFLDGYEAFR